MLKNLYNKTEIKQLNDELKSIHKEYKNSAPSVIDILKMDTDISQKKNY